MRESGRNHSRTSCSKPCEICGSTDFAFLFVKEAHSFWQCNICKLERIDPQPTDETLRGIYGRQYYDAWGLRLNVDQVRSIKVKFFRRQLGALLSVPFGSRLLDCGAATGFLMEAAAELGYEPYGVELSHFGAAAITSKFGPDRVFQGRLEDAVFSCPQEEFAAVCMFDFLEHVRDPRAALVKAHSFLAEGGQLLICTPDASSITRMVMGAKWLHTKVEHLFYFNSRNLPQLLTEVGFEVTRVGRAWKSMNFDYVYHQLSRYQHPVLTPVISTLARVVPQAVRFRPFPAYLGEMIMLTRKPANDLLVDKRRGLDR